MTSQPDVDAGQIFLYGTADRQVALEFTRFQFDGKLEFRKADGSGKRTMSADEYERDRSEGLLVRVTRLLDGDGVDHDLDPAFFADPEEVGIKPIEKAHRQAMRQRLSNARTLRFFCMRHDETPGLTHGRVDLRNLIAEHRVAATEAGFDWCPSPSALKRALENYGTPGNRPLGPFLTRGTKGKTERWDRRILELRDAMIAHYWSARGVRKGDAVNKFMTGAKRLREACEREFEAIPKSPKRSILHKWVNDSENYENYKSKYGKKSADARFRGRGRGMVAERILQYVLIDDTEVDALALFTDADGNVVNTARPTLTLAIDLYSRMILGAVLTYDGLSLITVMECLRQVVRRKTFLESRWGPHKGATDGWGKPAEIIVDRAWQNVGISFKAICEAAGIDVHWASVKTPTYKPYVERAISTLNQHVWHRLPGGIPHDGRTMSKMGIKPREAADRNIEAMADDMWGAIVTIYHVEPHSGIGMAPARKWMKGPNRKRPTIDDPKSLDKMFGRTHRVTLTAEGIYFRGHRFHDQATTSRMLDSVLRFASSRAQRKGPLSTGTAKIVIVADDNDCSEVEAWDPRRRISERFPNWQAAYHGLSYSYAGKLKSFVKQQNLAFHSNEEALAARTAYMATLGPRLKTAGARSRGRRQAVATLHRENANLGLGDVVVMATEEPSPSGFGDGSVPNALPAFEREDDRIPPKDARRGGKKATTKAVATRNRNKAAAKQASGAKPTAPAGGPMSAGETPSSKPLKAPVQVTEESLDSLAELERLELELARERAS
ncbi:DDE-type integrase/transposase/recombinase [Aureimonas jatrophae]|uniref:Integrase core domain-containing protein n=1 Tax=Aureimonas jatrophae TaxID=1166073 RepID=A0A1H0LGA4_9HYPH|nr:DDE-type integrase/transposase/recombinase [Aureimonas jatrophae]MBB3952507.1 putative transposase [Aureimonas jatrophae]SDO67204.1 Integrase core domain-containing protein [Aureimonas jatrophae]